MDPSPSTPGALYARWLAGRNAAGAPDFDALLAAHPPQAGELRQVHALWLELEPALRLAGLEPGAAPGFAERLRAAHGDDVDPRIALEGADATRRAPADGAPDRAPSTGAVSGALRAGLARGPRPHGRYRLEGEIARGGMGAILKVWDEDLRRHLAMKVVLGRGPDGRAGDASDVEPDRLARFLEEAQVTGQLSHPGIVPVHELGLDADGRVYFTMKLVKGRDLKTVFDLVHAGAEGWNETRALSLVLRACEALAYAHAKGVIHRDLKPANVMVGDFGEVYVMDWGLARVVGRQDRHDLRPAGGAPGTMSVRTERRDEREDAPDSPILTMDGDVVGTPAYMPPEQARGEVEKLSARSDVYAVGALLYHLLARQVPYVPRGARIGNRTVLALVIQGPPSPLHTLRPDVPAELAAIVEKAMAREPERRYPDTLALAEDLRAYLEHRVVGAYETGAWAEARKWVQRNRPLAAALATAVVLLVAGLWASLVYKARADENARLASRRAEETAEQARIATRKADEVLSLSAIQDLQDLVDRADALWPPHPAQIPAYEAWSSEARELLEGRPGDPVSGIKPRPGLARHRAKLAELATRTGARGGEVATAGRPGPAGATAGAGAADSEARWWHVQLTRLVADLEALQDPRTGLASSGISPQHGWGVPKRLEFARDVERRSVADPEARRRWNEAVAAIAASPRYAGLRVEPQVGLLPIGADPDSGLWEFAHLQSGGVPERGPDGRIARTEGMGIVLVLIPGGAFALGAQRADPLAPNFDPQASDNEGPVHAVELEPWFLSKYEMTQGQWLRSQGRNPSQYAPGAGFPGETITELDPVEQVSWQDCAVTLGRMGLEIPTEAQWERAARAGTTTPWCTGVEKESLAGAANLADGHCQALAATAGWAYDEWLDDGRVLHAPVGSYRANAYGLHDVAGNVWEWCRDPFGACTQAVRAGDGEREAGGTHNRASRGGSFSHTSAEARSARRFGNAPEGKYAMLGVRPSRPLRRADARPAIPSR